MSALLGYSLASFRPHGYDSIEIWLQRLRQYGFRSITLTPTFLVYDEDPPRLDLALGPSLTELGAAIQLSRQAGMRVRLEPHLDFESTLTGGPYQWRSRMKLDPVGPYLDDLLLPLATLGADSLTLGSELGESVSRYPEQWERVRSAVVAFPLALGQKINHDYWEQANPRARRYLSSLDWISCSFYPAMQDGEAGEIDRHLRRLAAQIPGPEFAIGEMGLGSADVRRPWIFDWSSFATPGDFQLRRRFYLDLLTALKRNSALIGREGATFWTVTHFDILGIMDERYADEAVIAAVIEYNGEDS